VLWVTTNNGITTEGSYGKVRAIAKTFTCVLNPVVTTCVMNRFQGHWLLSDVLNTCINLTQTMDIEMGRVVDVTNVLDPFDYKVFIFQKHMQAQIVKVIKLYFCFLIVYGSHQVHNMLALMFDPRFKSS
jgi:hypothetical protein